MKRIFEPEIARRITGIIFGLAGILALFVFIMLSKYIGGSADDLLHSQISADEREFQSELLTGILVYGLFALLYAYLRLCANAKNYVVRLCYKRKLYIVIYALVAIVSALAIVYIFMTNSVMKVIEICICVPLAFAILVDGYLYIKMLVDWLRTK